MRQFKPYYGFRIMQREPGNMESAVSIWNLNSIWRLQLKAYLWPVLSWMPGWLDLVDTQLFHRPYSSSLHCCLFFVLWCLVLQLMTALKFAGNTSFMKACVLIYIEYLDLNKPGMRCHIISHFSGPCCLYYFYEQSTARISF